MCSDGSVHWNPVMYTHSNGSAEVSSEIERIYHLDDLIYMRFMVGALAVCETSEFPVVNYRALNSKNNMNFSIWFQSDDIGGILYSAMTNVFPALIVGFALPLTTVPNRKLHTVVFWELLRLVPTFSLPPSQEFQLSLPNFLDPLPNVYEAIVALRLALKIPMAPRTLKPSLDPSYYTSAQTAVTVSLCHFGRNASVCGESTTSWRWTYAPLCANAWGGSRLAWNYLP